MRVWLNSLLAVGRGCGREVSEFTSRGCGAFRRHIYLMKFPLIFLIGTTMFLAACSTNSRQNSRQAFTCELSETGFFLKTLQALDSGDIAKTRRIALIPVCVDIGSMSDDAAESGLTAEEQQELIAVARGTLDYMLAHRQAFDGRLPSIQACVRGLRKILTAPEDVRRLTELTEYFGRQKP